MHSSLPLDPPLDTYERITLKPFAEKCLEKAGFTVIITNKQRHLVVFDEAHEMYSNKNFKATIVRPSEAYVYLQKNLSFSTIKSRYVYKKLLQKLCVTKSYGTCSLSVQSWIIHFMQSTVKIFRVYAFWKSDHLCTFHILI